MLSSHAYYAFEVNLFFSNYAEKIFVTQTKYLIFYCTAYHTSLDVPRNIRPYACARSERRPTHNYNIFTRRRVGSSLLFSLV